MVMFERLRKARRVLEEAEEAYSTVPSRAQPSLAHDATVILVAPGSGPLRSSDRADFVVAGALLLELASEGRIAASGEGKGVRITVLDPSPLGVVELDDALLAISTGVLGSKATRLVSVVPRADELVRRLLSEGVLVEETHTKWGLVSVRRYRPTPAAGRDELLARARGALLGESVPDDRTALIVAALYAGGNLKKCVPLDRFKDAQRHAAEILERLGDDERALVSAVDVAATRAGSDYSSSM